MNDNLSTVEVRVPLPTAAIIGRKSMPIRGSVSDQSIFSAICTTHQFEPHVMNAISSKLPGGGVFVDVGANIGIHSVLGAYCVGGQGRVLSIEASPATYLLLKENLALNGCGQATAVQRGVWDEHATISLSHIPHGPGWSFFATTGVREGETVDVVCDSLDALVEESGLLKVDLLKIDVEGAELKVFAGARETLKRHRPSIVLEVNPVTLKRFFDAEARDLYECVRGLGYSIKPIVPGLPGHPFSSYKEMEHLFQRGLVLMDVLCEPEG